MRQFTSALSFENNKDKLKYLGDKVYGLIIDAGPDGISNHEIAHELGIETATISGLTRPLVKMGLVEQGQKRKCKITGNLVIAWKQKIKNTLF
jgi:DNA-binding MarR family transcriptional regulator